jgi:hypothetical protein
LTVDVVYVDCVVVVAEVVLDELVAAVVVVVVVAVVKDFADYKQMEILMARND